MACSGHLSYAVQEPVACTVPRRRMPRAARVLRAGTLALMTLAVAEPARAHAPPEVSRILWPSGGDSAVLVTNRGLIFGDPASGDWSLMCSLALGIPFGAPADYALLPDGRLLAASSRGLQVTDNQGCDWQPVKPFGGLSAHALARHPAMPNTIYVSVSGAGRSGIEESRDGGATWTRLWTLADAEIVSQIILAPSQPMRIYANGSLPDPSSRALSHYLARSSDAGRSWQRFLVPLREGEREAILLSVNPLDPDLLLVLAIHTERGIEPDRLLVSRDGGESFVELWSELELSDADFGSDGQLVWVAGSYGLWKSNPAMTEVSALGSSQLMTCVQAREDVLYGCGHHSGFDPAGAGVGASANGGETFERWLAFPQVVKAVACAESSPTTQACDELWQDWKLEILDGLAGTDSEEPAEPAADSSTASSRPSDAGSARSSDARTATGSPRSEETGQAGKAGGCSLAASSMSFEEGIASWAALLPLLFRRAQKRRPRDEGKC